MLGVILVVAPNDTEVVCQDAGVPIAQPGDGDGSLLPSPRQVMGGSLGGVVHNCPGPATPPDSHGGSFPDEGACLHCPARQEGPGPLPGAPGSDDHFRPLPALLVPPGPRGVVGRAAEAWATERRSMLSRMSSRAFRPSGERNPGCPLCSVRAACSSSRKSSRVSPTSSPTAYSSITSKASSGVRPPLISWRRHPR